MVTVRKDHPLIFEGNIDIDKWLFSISKTTGQQEYSDLKTATQIASEIAADVYLPTGISCLEQGATMVEILATLIQDGPSLSAAMLYNCVQEELISIEDVSDKLSPEIAELINVTNQMDAFRTLQRDRSVNIEDKTQIERFRKMLLTLVKDVRGILIKLAEITCILKNAKNLPEEEQQRLAKETEAIYAPLANRLGIGQLKWELEDLAFRYLAPHTYKNIAKQLADKLLTRQEYIDRVIKTFSQALEEQEIAAFKVTGRVKHIFSIWKKMRRKDVSFNDIYDIRAVRILVDKVGDCYAVLGVVHSLWKHIPKEFDDYIASPKQNGYQSLHTAVIGPEGKVLEIQIRTHQMHQESEIGVAAHWQYKEGGKEQQESLLVKRVAWLKQLVEWQKDITNDEDFVEEVRSEVLQDRVYVFTPQGEVLDLPMGSTPIDFAYHIHSEVGHRCRGAKANGKLIPLNQPLKTGQQIEIMTGNKSQPSRDWMIRHNAYINTTKARSYIHRWFKKQDFDKNLTDGKNLLDKELKKIGLRNVAYDSLSKLFKFESQDKFLAALGAGDLRVIQILNAAQSLVRKEDESHIELPVASVEKKIRKSTADINIYGVDNLLTVIANCCKPVPGDSIIGYITQGRGVSVHRADCVNMKALEKSNANRIIDVNWGESASENYPVDLLVNAYERNSLFHEISKELANESVKLVGMKTSQNKADDTIDMHLMVEISNLNSLGRVLSKIGQIRNVIFAVRK